MLADVFCSTLLAGSPWAGSELAEKMIIGKGSGVGAGVSVGGGVGVGVGGSTVICVVWLADRSAPFRAVITNSVGLETETVIVPRWSRLATSPKSGPLILILVVCPVTDQAKATSAAVVASATTVPGLAVKNSIFGANGTGEGDGAGLTVMERCSTTGGPPLVAVSLKKTVPVPVGATWMLPFGDRSPST